MIDRPVSPTDGCTTVSIPSAVRTSELDYAVTEVITGIALWACFLLMSVIFDLLSWLLWYPIYVYDFMFWLMYWKWMNVSLHVLWFGICNMNTLILMIYVCIYVLLRVRCYSTEFAAHPSQPKFSRLLVAIIRFWASYSDSTGWRFWLPHPQHLPHFCRPFYQHIVMYEQYDVFWIFWELSIVLYKFL